MLELDVAAAVLETIARHTGASGLSFALPLQPLKGGFSGQGIYAFRLEDPPVQFAGDLVLRLMKDDDRSRREAVVQAAVAELGFPTPAVRLAGEGGGALGVPFLIMDRARGGSLLVGLRGREKARAFRRIPLHLAAVMAKLHELSPGTTQKRLTDRGWASDAIGVYSVLREIESLTRPVGIESFDAGLNWLHSQRPKPAAACLCHGDLHPQNLMLADGEVTAVLDWTNARIAEPILDVVYTAQLLEQMPIAAPRLLRPLIDALGRRSSRRFLEAYRQHRALDEAHFEWYEALHSLRLLARVSRARSPATADPPLERSHPWELVASVNADRFAALSGVRVLLPLPKAAS